MSFTSRGPADDPGAPLIGQDIEIYDHEQIIDSGQVEDATKDGRILWLAMEGAQPRRLIEVKSEWQIRVRSSTDSPLFSGMGLLRPGADSG